MNYLNTKVMGEKIRMARLITKLTIKEFSKKTGISSPTLWRIEKGKKIINIEELLRISVHTKKSILYFIQDGNNAIDYFYPPEHKNE